MCVCACVRAYIVYCVRVCLHTYLSGALYLLVLDVVELGDFVLISKVATVHAHISGGEGTECLQEIRTSFPASCEVHFG